MYDNTVHRDYVKSELDYRRDRIRADLAGRRRPPAVDPAGRRRRDRTFGHGCADQARR